MGERRRRVKSRNMYKGPMDKDNGEGRIECGRWGCVGQGRVMEEKMGTTVTEYQKIKNK